MIRRVIEYMEKVVKRLPEESRAKHSLLYLNFPLRQGVVPSWTSLLLPPVGVSEWVLRTRVAAKLYDEALAPSEFIEMARLARDEGSRYAQDRFVWILSQIVNPFNKVCYRYDRIDGKSFDQMQYPIFGNGDCEDTSEAVVRFMEGIATMSPAGLNEESRVVYDFVRARRPAMCVLTTRGAKLGRTAGAGGLHMMAVLVDTTGPQGTKIIPVETTGLSYNSYFTPDSLLTGESEPVRSAVLRQTRCYNRVCDFANRVSPAVVREMINYAVLVDAESPGSPVKGDYVARHHHFYEDFVMLMYANAGRTAEGRWGFHDFVVDANGKIGVPFADAIEAVGGWSLKQVDSPLDVNPILPLAQRYANNVMPAPSLAFVGPSEFPAAIQSVPAKAGGGKGVLPVRSVNFFINVETSSGARALIEDLHQKFKAKEGGKSDIGDCIGEVLPVDFVSVLGGAVNYYMLRVRLSDVSL